MAGGAMIRRFGLILALASGLGGCAIYVPPEPDYYGTPYGYAPGYGPAYAYPGPAYGGAFFYGGCCWGGGHWGHRGGWGGHR